MIDLDGPGGLFTRGGHIGGILGVGTTLANEDLNDYSGTTMPAKVVQINDDYGETPDSRLLVDGIYAQLNGWQQAQGGFLQQMQQLLQNTLIFMANEDTPLPSPSVQAAMALLIQQMTGVETVESSVPSVGSQTAIGSPNGNPVIIVSAKDNKGLDLQYLFPETLNFACVGDSQAATATLGQEPMQILGAAAVGNSLSFNWPGGSGCSLRTNCISATVDYPNQGGNSLVNSDFETYSVANTPDNWPIGVGIAGTTVFSSSTAYQGTKSLRYLGTGGAVPCSVSQQFGQSSGGTTFSLRPNTQYALKFWVQVPSVPETGVLVVDLATAATGGSVIADDQSVANSKGVTLTGLSGATWTQQTAIFRTPAVLPTNQFLRIRLTTAIESAKDVLIDSLALAPMTELYTGGPRVAIFSNASMLITGDAWTLGISNTYGLFQLLFEKCFSMRQLGMTLPNDPSPSISDALIS